MYYRPNGQKVGIDFPRLNNVPIFDFVEMFWNNLIDFCEEMMMMALCTRMPPLLALDRILDRTPLLRELCPYPYPSF
jgi:hypothetical protein